MDDEPPPRPRRCATATVAAAPSLLLVIGGFAVFFFAASIWLVRRLGAKLPAADRQMASVFGDARAQLPAFASLLPFLLLLYIVSWLDRVNVGFAKLQMNADLGFSDADRTENIRRIAPQARIIQLSARTGEGLPEWYAFLRSLADRT